MDDDQPSRAYPDPPAAQGGGFKGLGSRLALIPPLSFVLIVSLLPAAPSAWPGDSVAWLVVLNTLFLVVAPLIASYFAARAYAASGSIIILAIGSGLLLSGLSSHIAGHVMRGHGGTNSAVTIHNTGFLLCSLLNLAASWMSFSGGKKRKMLRGGRTLHVPVFYGASFLMVGLITLLALQDLLPAFFIPGQGPTPFRQAVLSLAVTFFLIASAAFMFIYFRIRVSFLCWYALSLLLIGQGLGIILFVDQLGSLMNWAGRAYQYLGGAYFLMAVVWASREARTRGISVEKALPALVDIEELKKAEDALRIQAQIIDQIHDPVLSTDLGGFVTSWNKGAEDGLGYRAEEALGRHISLIYPEEHKPFLQNEVIHPLMEKGHHELEVKQRRKSGETFFAHLSLSLLKDAHGDIHGMIGHAMDITERRKAEEASERNRALFQGTFENAAVGIAHIAPDGRLVRVNQKLCDIVGYGKDELHAMSFREITHPDDLPRDLELTEQLIKGEIDHFILEKRYIRKDGDVAWIRLTASMQSDDLGIGIIEDITDRRQAEKALSQSEEKFRTIFQMNPVVMVISSLEDGRFIDVNKACEEVTGYSREEIIGRTSFDIELWPDPEVRQMMAGMLFQKGCLRDIETVIRTKSGELKDAVFSAEVIVIKGVSYAMSGWLDITEQKRMEKELRRSRDELETRVAERTSELEQRAEQLTRLWSDLTLAEKRERRRLAEIIHDNLQQLIVGAKIRLEVLGRDIPDSHRRNLEEIHDLLLESLKTSRSLNTQLAPHVLYDHGLAPALEWLAQTMEQTYPIDIDTDITAGITVESENLKVLLFESARELLFNVVKHARTSSARIEMSRHDGDSLRISISDRGVGFDSEKLRRDLAQNGGFGLFSISERLELIGGRLEMESPPGRGAAFHLIAPLEKDIRPKESLEEEDVIPSGKTAAPASQEQGLRVRVLVVDDHVVMRQGLSTMIARQPDIEVVGEAADGSTAVQMARELRPDVILMDINMPGMDGVEATRIIHAEAPDIRIVGLSMYDDTETSKGMLNVGAAAFVAKSGHTDLLLDAIRKGKPPRPS